MAVYEALYAYEVIVSDGIMQIDFARFGGEVAYILDDSDGSSHSFEINESLLVDSDSLYRFIAYTVYGPITVIEGDGGSPFTAVLWTNNGTLNEGDLAPYFETAFTVCFLAGTSVATPAGACPVETLAIVDLVLTADGRAAPVRWVGRQSVVRMFADPLRTFPVRITAGALGEGLPVRDLLVSQDHALMLDGVLVQAGALVNGASIRRETAMPERFTYYHVELDDHALILAEGVPAETFVDNVTRRRFDNFAEYAALYGETAAPLIEMDAPRVKSARQLPKALSARFAAQSALVEGGAASAA